jgi:predicted phosphodiesterase
MRVFISTDIHANILAAEKAVKIAKSLGCDQHIHIGDSVDLGPRPEETFQFLHSESVILLMGNHEEYHCSKGFGQVIDERMDDNERGHYEWTACQLSNESTTLIDMLPYSYSINEHRLSIHFQHFPLGNGRISEERIELSPHSFCNSFEAADADLYFFGHIHKSYDSTSIPRYICPGATGVVCFPDSSMTALCLDISKGGFSLTKHLVEWDLEKVRKEVKAVLKHNCDWLLENMYKVCY